MSPVGDRQKGTKCERDRNAQRPLHDCVGRRERQERQYNSEHQIDRTGFCVTKNTEAECEWQWGRKPKLEHGPNQRQASNQLTNGTASGSATRIGCCNLFIQLSLCRAVLLARLCA